MRKSKCARARTWAALAAFVPVALGGCAARRADEAGKPASNGASALLGDTFVVAAGISTDRAGFFRAASGSVFAPSFERDGAGTTRGVVFFSDGHGVEAWDPTGAVVWRLAIDNLGIVPSIDWDADGVADVFVAERIHPTVTVSCVDGSGLVTSETESVPSTLLHFRSGIDGHLLFTFGAQPDFCWTNRGAHSFYPQWTTSSVLASATEHSFAVSPYYAQQSFTFTRAGSGAVQTGGITYPGNPSFGDVYPNAHVVVPATSSKYVPNSHVWNGLLFDHRVEFFTSGRFAAFDLGASTPPLAFDAPVDPSGTLEGGGRNYGLVAKDPASSLVGLVAGCSVASLFEDQKTGTRHDDPACGINRHFTLIDSAAGSLRKSAYYSYSNAPTTSAKDYVDRVTYPSNPIVRQASGPSVFIYNSFAADGRWYIHASQPGTTDDLWRVPDAVVWDVLDIDQDGTDEILYSPTSSPGYFPQRSLVIAHFEGGALVNAKTIDGVLPLLVASPRRDLVATSEAALFSATRVLGKASSLYVWDGNVVADGHAVVPMELDYLSAATAAATPPPPRPAPAPPPAADPPPAPPAPPPVLGWVTESTVDIACQYQDQGPIGSQQSGGCSVEGALNVYEWGTGQQGACAAGTFLRQRVTQRCKAN